MTPVDAREARAKAAVVAEVLLLVLSCNMTHQRLMFKNPHTSGLCIFTASVVADATAAAGRGTGPGRIDPFSFLRLPLAFVSPLDRA